MIREYVLAQVGGEFGIGGIFTNDQIYDTWEKFSPTLQRVLWSLEQRPPILQAAIISKAPQNVIRDIISSYQGCILRRDSFGRLSINVAMEKDLKWGEGMKEVVEATAESLERPIIHVAAEYGLKWDNNMEELVNTNVIEVLNGRDGPSGLSLFMLAALGDTCDLSSIYAMAKMNPGTFGEFSSRSNMRKRKREE